MSFDRKRKLIAAMAVFVLLTIIIYVVYDVHRNKYLTSRPDNSFIPARVTYDIDKVRERGSVGNEWGYEHLFNNQEFKNGDVLSINADDSFSITTKITEYDDISDVGKAIERCSYEDYKNPLVISQSVRVVERGGKRYAGSFADFNVVYTFERIVPKDMNVFDVYFYTSSILEHMICVLLVVGQTMCIAVIIFNLIKRKETYK